MGYLIIYLLLEPVKRVASALLYPVAYALRGWSRWKICIIWPGYLHETRFFPAWLFLDDSAFMEFKPLEYADNEKYYPAFIWRTNSDFLKAYWWAAIRNSCVNWNNYSAYKTGEFVCVLSHYGFGENGRNFYQVRSFSSGQERPYCEFWTFGRRNQVGWIRKGRFEIDILKRIV